MNSSSYEYKKQVYKKWLENGQNWYHIDKSKEATVEERKIILEMLKQEQQSKKHDKEIEKRAAEIRERYGKRGMISDKIFNALDNY